MGTRPLPSTRGVRRRPAQKKPTRAGVERVAPSSGGLREPTQQAADGAAGPAAATRGRHAAAGQLLAEARQASAGQLALHVPEDGLDASRPLVGPCAGRGSARPGAPLGSRRAQPHAARTGGSERRLGPLRGQLALALGDRGQDVDRERVRLGQVGEDHVGSRVEQRREEGDAAAQAV